MKLRSAAGVLAVVLALPALAQDRAAVPADLEKRLREFEAAFSAHDAEKLGSLFSPDGSLINPMGERADGRDQVAAQFRKSFDGVLKGTKTRLDIKSARLVTPDVALVDVEQQLTGGSPPPNSPSPRTAHVVALLGKGGGGEWMFLDARPYFFLPRGHAAGKKAGEAGAHAAPSKR